MKTFTKKIGVPLVLTGLLCGSASSQTIRDLYSDTWVATDALGRSLPTFNEVGAPRAKQAGIFYFLWQQGNNGGPYDIASVLAANPNAMTNPDSPLWGPVGAFHYWTQPLFGYYQIKDPWVHRRHAQMLSNAGVDMVLFDASNGPAYEGPLDTLATTWLGMRAQGNATPQFAYHCQANGDTTLVNFVYNNIYKKNLYKDLWYYWEGKPLIVAVPNPALSSEILNFFTWRKPYWNGLNPGPDSWTLDGYYPLAGDSSRMFNSAGQLEQMAAATSSSLNGVSSNEVNGNGRSWRGFTNGGYREANATPKGGHYSDEWSKVMQYDPQFALHYCWNEWVAQRGFDSGTNRVKFVDQFNQEHSKDIEPMLGGFGDNYYMQMVGQQRQFKGARPLPSASAAKTISMTGAFTQWDNVAPMYYDAVGDTAARNFAAWGAGTYTDNSGRNDIIASKVAQDATNVYFWAQTNTNMSAYTGSRWMQLLLNVDGNHTNGWNGYDFIVNRAVTNATTTQIKRYSDNVTSNITYNLTGNQLMLTVPRSVLGVGTGAFSIDFHWADNCPADVGSDIRNFWTTGDHAPDGRFNYRYISQTTGLSSGTYKVVARHSGKCLEVSGGGTANSSNVSQWTYSGASHQRWTATLLGGNQYKITSLASGRALDVFGGSTADGANIDIFDYSGANHQKWTLTPTSGGYHQVTAVHSGKAMEVSAGSLSDGANVQQWTYGGGNHAQWAFQGSVADGTYKVVARHSGKCLEVGNGATANSSNVRQWSYSNVDHKKWTLTHLGSNQYKIIGVGSGRSLDVFGGGTGDGTNIDIYDYSGANHQKWILSPTSSGYYKVTALHSGKAMEVSAASLSDGANVQQRTYNGSNHAQWIFQAP